MQIEIRRMTVEDLDQVMEIEPVAFGSHHWSRQSFLNELSNSTGHYFTAYEKETNAICGYSGFWLIGEEAHITTLAVHPDFRRKYVGERLLINDIRQAQQVGANWLTLEVRISNESAQGLYSRYGFKSQGVLRKYYQDNDEDALVLWSDKICSAKLEEQISERMEIINKGQEIGSK